MYPKNLKLNLEFGVWTIKNPAYQEQVTVLVLYRDNPEMQVQVLVPTGSTSTRPRAAITTSTLSGTSTRVEQCTEIQDRKSVV